MNFFTRELFQSYGTGSSLEYKEFPLDLPLLLYAQFKHSGVYSEVLKLEVVGTKVMTESDQE